VLNSNPEWKTYLEKTLHLALLSTVEKHLANGKTIATAMETVVNTFTTEYSKINFSDVQKANNNPDLKARTKELHQIFSTMAKSLYEAINLQVPLPFPSLTKKFAEKSLLDFITDQLAAYYIEWNIYRNVAETAKNNLNRIA